MLEDLLLGRNDFLGSTILLEDDKIVSLKMLLNAKKNKFISIMIKFT